MSNIGRNAPLAIEGPDTFTPGISEENESGPFVTGLDNRRVLRTALPTTGAS